MLHDWQEIADDITGADPAAAQAQADALWATLTGEGQVPLVLDDQVLFLYKGPAQRVVSVVLALLLAASVAFIWI